MGRVPLLLYYANPHMYGRRCLDDAGGLELDVFAAEVLERPGAASEEHGSVGAGRPRPITPMFVEFYFYALG
ncbi:MAG TPA: hypothetical protein VK902_23260 [Rubrobacter sp.]|nr:hypothetical protein [Rubrobacter sp.]